MYTPQDAHSDEHHLAVVDARGRLLGAAAFPTTAEGQAGLIGWVCGYGEVDRVGVESTGAYAAGLVRALQGGGIRVVEVNQPHPHARQRRGERPLHSRIAPRRPAHDPRAPLGPDRARLAAGAAPPGDVLFFNGPLLHGSKPTRSDRFRRSLIGHRIDGDARRCALGCHPAFGLTENSVELERRVGGGACGEWVDGDGRLAIEQTGVAVDPPTTEQGRATARAAARTRSRRAAQDGEPPPRHAPNPLRRRSRT